MSIDTFLDKWDVEKSLYKAWGDFVTGKIIEGLINNGRDVSSYLKQPAKARVKEDSSLIDKAFYRKGKNYNDPYNDIEDKVGTRFVVLLLEHIEEINNIINTCGDWRAKECRHFESERDSEPLLFTYQSVHYVVRSQHEINHNGILIPEGIPCEIQIRTLLQHAYAELTHDAIYKAKKRVEPKVHRTVAKSMALIETTDEFFSSVNGTLNHGNIEDNDIVSKLDDLYELLIGNKPLTIQKSSITILDEFDDLLDGQIISNIDKCLQRKDYIIDVINEHRDKDNFYQQGVSLFVAWMIVKKKHRLINDWPLNKNIIDSFATDLGVSIDEY
ncbi:GTP pyrophosphokinase [Photobacterium leiognathi]|uniref:GTP pyrophosphokinase n=1 Tax=Photobacterium leiognathi TaxID=553611 RepID=UPI002732BA1F|nr:hypothetical protein [Photobacterium leiognathi]